MNELILPIAKIQPFISIESLAAMVLTVIAGLVFYKMFLRKISEQRHANLKGRFKGIYGAYFVTLTLSILYWTLISTSWSTDLTIKIANYMALIAFIITIYLIIKIAQIFVYFYLFWMNMSQGVPRLIANIFTLVFATILVSWVAAEVFAINLAAVLATSAIFTIVLGLALQDTLGNLFSGVALQMERPFHLGDWVEIQCDSQKWVGQIQEITWRATSMTGFGEELIIIPNKLIAQSQLIVFNEKNRPARFGQQFKFALNSNQESIKSCIYEALEAIPEIMEEPRERVLIGQITEQWILVNVFYSIRNYGNKNIIADSVNTLVLDNIRRKNLSLAMPILEIKHEANANMNLRENT